MTNILLHPQQRLRFMMVMLTVIVVFGSIWKSLDLTILNSSQSIHEAKEEDMLPPTTTATTTRRKRKKTRDYKTHLQHSHSHSHSLQLLQQGKETTTQQQHEEEPKNNNVGRVYLFDSEKKKQEECWISLNNATFVGCGEQGQTYMVPMNCFTITNNNDSNNNKTIQKNVILKLTVNRDTQMFTNSIPRRYQYIYQTLFPPQRSITQQHRNSNKIHVEEEEEESNAGYIQRMHRRFHIGFGHVEININKLLVNVINNSNFTTSYNNRPCGDIVKNYNLHHQYLGRESEGEHDVVDDDDDVIRTGMILSVAKGQTLLDYFEQLEKHSSVTTKTTKSHTHPMYHHHHGHHHHHQTIVHQMVCIWRHMYLSNFVHDDIVNSHIYFDAKTKTTSLIDFPDHTTILDEQWKDWRMMKDNDNDNNNNEVSMRFMYMKQRQMLQLYQLLVFISNICMDDDRYQYSQHRHSYKFRHSNTMPAMKKCTNHIKYDYILGHKNNNTKHPISVALKQCFGNVVNSNSNNITKKENDDDGNSTNKDDDDDDVPYLILKLFYDQYQKLMYQIYPNDREYHITSSSPPTTTNPNQRTLPKTENKNPTNEISNNNDDFDYDDVVGRIYNILVNWSGGGGGDIGSRC